MEARGDGVLTRGREVGRLVRGAGRGADRGAARGAERGADRGAERVTEGRPALPVERRWASRLAEKSRPRTMIKRQRVLFMDSSQVRGVEPPDSN